jgi:hypothetical protein
MIRRRYRVRPPSDAEVINGEMIVFTTEDDRVNAGKPLPLPVTLTPVGPVPEMIVFTAEDDRVANPPKEPSGDAR